MENPGFDVGYVARLAHIDLAEDETERFASQLGDILTYMEKLKELDVSGVEPTMHGHGRVNAFREDEPAESPDKERLLANAPGRIGDEYRLPKIVEEA